MARLASSLRRLFADPGVAVDLGTANTRLAVHGRGFVGQWPSLAEPRAGAEGPAIAPLRSGVVVDVEAAAELLRPLLRQARRLGLARPWALVCAPTDASEQERADLVEATRRAGAGAVEVVPEPLAAAIGAGLDVGLPYGQMLVDVGEGVTDVAVVRGGALAATAAVRTACAELHAAVRDWLEEQHGVRIDKREAEWLTRSVGTLDALHDGRTVEVAGVEREGGHEVLLRVPAAEVALAIEPGVRTIVGTVCEALRRLPDGLAAEAIESGLCLTGGGAGLPGLAGRLAAATGLDVRVAADPLRSVIEGARQILDGRLALGGDFENRGRP